MGVCGRVEDDGDVGGGLGEGLGDCESDTWMSVNDQRLRWD